MSTVTIPTVDEEIWRYSRIGELDLERFRPGQVTTTIDGPADSIKKLFHAQQVLCLALQAICSKT